MIWSRTLTEKMWGKVPNILCMLCLFLSCINTKVRYVLIFGNALSGEECGQRFSLKFDVLIFLPNHRPQIHTLSAFNHHRIQQIAAENILSVSFRLDWTASGYKSYNDYTKSRSLAQHCVSLFTNQIRSYLSEVHFASSLHKLGCNTGRKQIGTEKSTCKWREWWLDF